MKTLTLLVLLAALLGTKAPAAETEFQNHRATIPEGWTVMPSAFECIGSSIVQTLVLRNDSGTIWIIAQALPPAGFDTAAKGIEEEWTLRETGDVAGFPYTVFSIPLKPENKNSHAIEFPTLHTFFSFLFTTNGNKDAAEAMKSWNPPAEKESEEYFQTAKGVVFDFVQGMKIDKK